MERSDERYSQFVSILREELVPAMGCTEPVAIAYAAAKAADILSARPDRMSVEVSGNIIKNVKSVIVPHTGGLRGIKAAAAAGAVAGDADAELEVISKVTPGQIKEIEKYLEDTDIRVELVSRGHVFDLGVTACAGKDSAYVRIVDHHTNIVESRRNRDILVSNLPEKKQEAAAERDWITIDNICEFAETVDIEDVRETLQRQIDYNMAIAEEGLRGQYGANIGKVLLVNHEDDLIYKMRAYAAAASDARMNGCELPVVINSGSGNQGITASVPVIVCARHNKEPEEKLFRALVVSNLVTIHLKEGIGTLSAYCGVVSAGCGAGAGLTYLNGGDVKAVRHAVVNAVAVDSGIICDGAKASCAAKIAAAVDAGLLGMKMYKYGNQFFGGDGIVRRGVENTIKAVNVLASRGMKGTDEEIIRLMMEEERQ